MMRSGVALAALAALAACSPTFDEPDEGPQGFAFADVRDQFVPSEDEETAAEPDVPTPGEEVLDEDTASPCTESELGNLCAGLEFNETSGQCELVSRNEGVACREATCTSPAGLCNAGVCTDDGPTPCLDLDPDGCWWQTCDEATVTCVKHSAEDGIPCGTGHFCLAGACTFALTCPTAPPPASEPSPLKTDPRCAGKAGCEDVCVPDTCGCWLCDGPFCVDSRCDDSGMPLPQGLDLSLTAGWAAEPAAGVLLDPAPALLVPASPEWDSAAPAATLDLRVVMLFQGVPFEARWTNASGTVETKELIDPAIIGVRLLVASVETKIPPCEDLAVTSAGLAPVVLAPVLGDVGTAEFVVPAAAQGSTLLAFVRVVEDTEGDRYYQWVRLGGLAVPDVTKPPENPTLEALAYAPIPAANTSPLGPPFAGIDWRALIDASVP